MYIEIETYEAINQKELPNHINAFLEEKLSKIVLDDIDIELQQTT